MDRETILQTAQEGPKHNEYEDKKDLKINSLSLVFSLLVAIIILAIQYFKDGTINLGVMSVVTLSEGFVYLTRGICLRKIFGTIIGSVFLILGILFFVAFVCGEKS